MKNYKLFIATIATAVAVPAIVLPMQAEAAVVNPFKDVSKNSPYYEIVHEMRDQRIISGYENGEFRPSEVITRKHAAALVNRATKLPTTKPFVPFKDVSTKNAFFNDVKKLQQAGIFEPDSKGNFNPNKPITRAEMAKVLTIAFDLKVKVELDFMDVPKDHPANQYVRALYSNGITTGDFGFYWPEKPVTRVHYAVFLHRLLHMDDPIDPSAPALRLPGQFAGISAQELERNSMTMANTMLSMLRQKVTPHPSDYLITDVLEGGWAEVNSYSAGHSSGQMAKENILYLKRFVDKNSELEAILDKWLQGDFSQVKNDYFVLRRIGDYEYGNCDVCEDHSSIHIRTKKAEEHFVVTIYGEEGLKRHKEQWD
ncbi:S-layer homology domain-containing protein [Sporosarcina sp. ACRSM]|uniref:S-layer homology domain-containing protein n=1 Tax=Sporosarcina sp. ACRSM TaxID=2918216 RepID=UPI001EF6D9D8|nr:S-layer homology domain-containing protein [Sporosarcina sp. ACRSM]MCG7333664.1 S-layer homology domain-containing protein [Sporosarcina sp. ACRSM]